MKIDLFSMNKSILALMACGLGFSSVAMAQQTAPALTPTAVPAARVAPVAPAAPGAAAASPVRFLVTAGQESVLSAAVGGRIQRVVVGLGDSVRAGQALVSFDCAETRARQDAAKAEAESARVQYEGKLKLQGLQSAAEIEVELAAANVNKAQSQVRIFDAQISQCVLTAPFAGKVARVHVKVGQGVNPGAPIMELVSGGALKARMNVPSQWLAWLKVGEKVSGKIDETGSPVDMKVTRIAGRVDAVSQTVEIESEFAVANAQVLPGMSGQLQAPTGH